MTAAVSIRGLYAVTPDATDTARLAQWVEAALVGGAALVQYRNKMADANLRMVQARTLQALCETHRVPLIINDYPGLAAAVGAAGLHVGQDDGSLHAARACIGPGKLLGASCYNRIDAAVAAEAEGADYVAFGSFFPSTVKPGAVRATPALLRDAKKRLRVPIVAIGGITLENAAQLISAGVDSIAVISALFGAPDVRLAAQEFEKLFASAPAT